MAQTLQTASPVSGRFNHLPQSELANFYQPVTGLW